MDTTIQAVPSRTTPSVLQVAAVMLALVLGIAFGSIVTRSIAPADASPAAATWDAQKLVAYGQRLQFTRSEAPAPAWDAQKLDALEGRLAAG